MNFAIAQRTMYDSKLSQLITERDSSQSAALKLLDVLTVKHAEMNRKKLCLKIKG